MRTPLLLCIGLLTLALSTVAPAQPPPAIPDAQAAEHIGKEAAVTGRVATVATRGTTTFLNLGAAFPNHTFTGVVFSDAAEKIGDLKQYEGKVVTISGRIEDRQGKPQIVIRSAEQIRPADGAAPAAPMPAAAPAPSAASTPPAPASSAPTPAPVGEIRKIALGANWNSPQQAGGMTRKDLALLFTGQGSSDDGSDDTSIIAYGGVPYLTPLAETRKRLNLENTPASKARVTCPGLPIGSFTAHTFTGVFEGGFNRLLLITDNADQLVSALVLDENSRQRVQNETDATGYHTYNFIQHRVKGNDDLVIRHEIKPVKGRVIIVDSMLIDPNDELPKPRTSSTRSSTTTTPTTSKTGKVLERSRWYVPAPVAQLILRCAGSSR